MSKSKKALVIYKKSAVQLHVEQNKDRRLAKLIKQGHEAVKTLWRAHEEHVESLTYAEHVLKTLGVRATFRSRGAQGSFKGFDWVITMGGDGTLLWASHRVGSDTPMLAINTAPSNSVGFFCANTGMHAETGDVLRDMIQGGLHETVLTRMRIDLDGKCISARVLNDMLFAHASPASMSRYLLKANGVVEDHKSSGVWVGPSAGSTAAQLSAGGMILPVESPALQFVVRELYQPAGVKQQLNRGLIEPPEALEIVSKMIHGRLFVDGTHLHVEVPVGGRVVMKRSSEPLHLLGFQRKS